MLFMTDLKMFLLIENVRKRKTYPIFNIIEYKFLPFTATVTFFRIILFFNILQEDTNGTYITFS